MVAVVCPKCHSEHTRPANSLVADLRGETAGLMRQPWHGRSLAVCLDCFNVFEVPPTQTGPDQSR